MTLCLQIVAMLNKECVWIPMLLAFKTRARPQSQRAVLCASNRNVGIPDLALV